jgi:acyl-CoA thioesterase-1
MKPAALAWLLAAALFSGAGLRAQMNERETMADAAVPQNKAMAPAADVPGLPRVLLIGDSISIAYTLPVRQMLEGRANVHRIPVNGSSTLLGLSGVSRWTADGKWDVIHFNFGLHDAKLQPATGLPATSREAYVKNLEEIAKKLQATGAKVLFATTTPIPAALTAVPAAGPLAPGTRLFDSIPERNALAVEALQKRGVGIVDLYSAILPCQEKLQHRNDVHYNAEGSQILAKAVAESIAAQLSAKSP